MSELFNPIFRVTYSLNDETGIKRKYFTSAEKCREWYVLNKSIFSSSVIVEQQYIPFNRLCMLAQLERECTALGKD